MKFGFKLQEDIRWQPLFREETFLVCQTKTRGKDLLFDVRDHLRSHLSDFVRRCKARFITSDNN